MSFFHQVFFSGFGSPSGAADELPAEEAEDEPRPDEAEAWARSEAAADEPRPEVSAERALPLREEPSREVPSSVSGAVFPPLRLLRSRSRPRPPRCPLRRRSLRPRPRERLPVSSSVLFSLPLPFSVSAAWAAIPWRRWQEAVSAILCW